MADTRDNAESARNRAQSHFQTVEKRDVLVREEIARERVATDAKTAKLRALRLAKEEADRIAAENAPKPAPKTSAKKKNTIATG